jgi:hypothetical protein
VAEVVEIVTVLVGSVTVLVGPVTVVVRAEVLVEIDVLTVMVLVIVEVVWTFTTVGELLDLLWKAITSATITTAIATAPSASHIPLPWPLSGG